MATPPHLCHHNACGLYPSSFDNKKPIRAVSAAMNAVASSSHLPISSSGPVAACLVFACRKILQVIYSNNNTIGKCNTRGCIRPITCSHDGTCNLSPANTNNTSIQLKESVLLKTMFFQRCMQLVLIYFFLVLILFRQ